MIIVDCLNDNTGLGRFHSAAHCPVIGASQATMSLAALYGNRFGNMTKLDVPVPEFVSTMDLYGDRASTHFEDALAITIARTQAAGAGAIVPECAEMYHIRHRLMNRADTVLVDGMLAPAIFAEALAIAEIN